MKIKLLSESEQNFSEDIFYQSNNWINISKKSNIPFYRLLLTDKNEPIIYSNIFEYSIPYLGKYFFIPKGPIILTKNLKKEHLHKFYKEIKNLGKKNNIIFCSVESPKLEEENTTIEKYFYQKYFANFPKNKLPIKSHILDLTLGKEKLFSNLKSKTRYNINLAKKKGVKIEFLDINTPNFTTYFDKFYEILRVTATRNTFGIHTKHHYINILEEKSENFNPFLAIAKFEDEILAGNIMLNTKTQSIYLHGGSSDKLRNFMAPYLLQWACIEKAITEKKGIYDFWGISDNKDSWAGLTRFKRSFQGKDISYEEPKAIIMNRLKFYAYLGYIFVKNR